MARPNGTSRRDSLRAAVETISRSPTHLRVVVAVSLVGVWYLGVYKTLVSQIEAARVSIATTRTKLDLAEEITSLREEAGRVQGRIPEVADANDAYHQLLKGVQSLPVHLSALTPGTTGACGPYRVLSFNLSATGRFEEIGTLLHWIEANPRIMRVDQLRIASAAGDNPNAIHAAEDNYKVDLTLLEIMGLN